MAVLPQLEQDFQDAVAELAQTLGWMVAHFRAEGRRADGSARTAVQYDGKGFPDLTLVRGDVLMFVECKIERNQPSPSQSLWITRLRAAGVRVEVWRPEDWSEIERVLARPRSGART